MDDLQNMDMSQLVASYNALADVAGVPHEDTFKSLAVARASVATLNAKVTQMNQATTPTSGDAPTETPSVSTTTQYMPTEEEITAVITQAIEAGTDPDAAVAALMNKSPTGAPGDKQKYNSSGKRGPNQGIGSFAKEQILNGQSNAAILEMIRTQFPTAKTSASCIAYYRTALKKDGTSGKPGVAQKTPTQMREEALKMMTDADDLEEAQRMQAEQEAAEAQAKAEALAAAAVKAKEIVAAAQAARAAQQELIAKKVQELQAQREAILAKAKESAAAAAAAQVQPTEQPQA
jgi:hypothetical protein